MTSDDMLRMIGWILVGIVVAIVVRWAWAEYYIATHCTTILGTRVCQ